MISTQDSRRATIIARQQAIAFDLAVVASCTGSGNDNAPTSFRSEVSRPFSRWEYGYHGAKDRFRLAKPRG